MREKSFPDKVYIGRGSYWGNPFRVGKDGTRDQCIQKFSEYVVKFNEKEMEDFLRPLRGKDLICFCAPNRCHGDILLKLLESTPDTQEVLSDHAVKLSKQSKILLDRRIRESTSGTPSVSEEFREVTDYP